MASSESVYMIATPTISNLSGKEQNAWFFFSNDIIFLFWIVKWLVLSKGFFSNNEQ